MRAHLESQGETSFYHCLRWNISLPERHKVSGPERFLPREVGEVWGWKNNPETSLCKADWKFVHSAHRSCLPDVLLPHKRILGFSSRRQSCRFVSCGHTLKAVLVPYLIFFTSIEKSKGSKAAYRNVNSQITR